LFISKSLPKTLLCFCNKQRKGLQNPQPLRILHELREIGIPYLWFSNFCRIDGLGWRRGTIITSKNGRVKEVFMLYNGQEHSTFNAIYQIRTYEGSNATYTPLKGADFEQAKAILDRLNETKTYQASVAKFGIIPDKRMRLP
jgi:hypothetical protein